MGLRPLQGGHEDPEGITDPEAGDAYCFIGLERHSKLVLAWHLGRRNTWDTHDFMEKLSAATAGRFQLTTDGLNAYPDAVEYNFGARVDYAQLVKEFGAEGGDEQRRYAPPRLIGAEKISRLPATRTRRGSAPRTSSAPTGRFAATCAG